MDGWLEEPDWRDATEEDEKEFREYNEQRVFSMLVDSALAYGGCVRGADFTFEGDYENA